MPFPANVEILCCLVWVEMSQKQLLCDFRAKIDFLSLIDCLGVKLLENYAVQFFRALDPILRALNEDHALFVPFRHCKY